MSLTAGKAFEYKGGIVIYTSRPPLDNLSDKVTVVWQDRRQISPEQRRKAYALIGEIAEWSGYSRDTIKNIQKHDYMKKHLEGLHQELFSLGDCDMTTARDFITYLIDFMLENDVPSKRPLYELNDDVEKYVYACLMLKKCAVCGQKAELHHVDRVGMGYNRHEINHIGMKALPLCREHHMEAHQHGDKALMDKYHLIPIEIDDRIAKKHKLKGVTA